MSTRDVRLGLATGRHMTLVVGLLGFLGLWSSAQAVYYVDLNATGTENGLSWSTAFRTLSNATAKAVGEFWVASNVYLSPAGGVDIKTNKFYGGFTNGMTSLAQRDWVAYPTILDGNGTNILNKTLPAGSTTFDGFVFRNGTSKNGGVFNSTIGIELLFYNCVFTNNTAATGSGGALYPNASRTHLVCSNCSFIGNSAAAGNGGVISYNKNSCTSEFYMCVFYNNSATQNGGAVDDGQGTVHTFVGCLFSNNQAGAASYGGALNVSGPLTLKECDFAGNSAGYGGGAMQRLGGTSNLYQNCSFVDNQTTNALSGNPAGAIADYPAIGTMTTNYFVNCTFFTNGLRGSASGVVGGGAIRGSYTSSTSFFCMVNCILSGNWYVKTGGATTNALPSDIYLQGGANAARGQLTLSYTAMNTNLITGGIPSFGSGITNVNPLFASTTVPYDTHLKSTGGRWNPATGTRVKDAVSSPCINAGDPASDYSLEPDYPAGHIELGRYGNTAQASLSPAILQKATVFLFR